MKNEVIKWAFERGYRINENGDLVSPKGHVFKPVIKKFGYCTTSFRMNGHIYSISYHRFAAYQKYGEIVFAAPCVRHLDGNPANNRLDNIEIGTQHDNMMDIPEDIRRTKAEYATSFVRKWNKEEIRKYYNKSRSYRDTMFKFNISSKGTLWFILNK